MSLVKEAPFDPFETSRDVKEHPDNYVSMKSIVEDAKTLRRVRASRTMHELKKIFSETAKEAKDRGDETLLGWIIEAKDARKNELEGIDE